MSNTSHTPAGFITDVETNFKTGRISADQRKALLRDMSALLTKLNNPAFPSNNHYVSLTDNGSILILNSTNIEIDYSKKDNPNWAMYEETTYNRRGLHSYNDEPSYIRYSGNGEVQARIWYANNEPHRDGDKPAMVDYHDNGNIMSEEWWFRDRVHRDAGKPAKINYDQHGKILGEQYWINGSLQERPDGR